MDVNNTPVANVEDDAINCDVGQIVNMMEDDQRTPVTTQNSARKRLVPTFIGGNTKCKARRKLLFEDDGPMTGNDYNKTGSGSDNNDNDDNDNNHDRDDHVKINNDRNNSEYDRQKEEILRLKSCPTVDRFVFGERIIDLRGSLPGFECASEILANVYNTLVYIVKLKNTLLSLKNRKLTIQLRASEHHLQQLEENDYVDAHIKLPQIMESLFSMWDYRSNCIYINQLKPISCVLSKRFISDHVSFRSMEATCKNESEYIELVFNNPFRFVFVGISERVGQHKKNTVDRFPFFGEYIDRAIASMYDVMYDMVTREIKKAKKEMAAREPQAVEAAETAAVTGAAATTPVNSLQMMETFSNTKQARQQQQDTERLRSYLRSINLPLAKNDNVKILVTSGNSGKNSTDTAKMCYLAVEKNKDADGAGHLNMIENDVTEDAVYMSSYIRCRVLMLDQPSFAMQIYTRHAVKLVRDHEELVKFNDFQKNV